MNGGVEAVVKVPTTHMALPETLVNSGLSPLRLSLLPVARIPDGHACLGHRRLLRCHVAGLGGGLALPQSWKWGWGAGS